MADDEESDWEELQGYISDLDICSDSDDDMAGLKPVEPNPAYQGKQLSCSSIYSRPPLGSLTSHISNASVNRKDYACCNRQLGWS